MVANVLNWLIPEVNADTTGQSSYLARKGMAIIVFALGGFLLWGMLAPISGAVIAPGVVKIVSHRKTVQHLDGGIVKEILVRDGTIVKQGQPLVLLEDTKNSAELNILIDELNALRAKEARLTAEKLLTSKVKFPDDMQSSNSQTIKELIAKENDLFRTKRSSLIQQINLLEEEIRHAHDAQNSLDQQIKAIEENIQFKQEQVQMREGLYEKKFVGKTDVLNYKQSLTDKHEMLGEKRADKFKTSQQISDLKLRIVGLKSKYAEDADNELKDTAKQMFEIKERIRPAQGTLDRSVIRAPIDGQIIDMKVTTIGGVVRSGEPLMEIVPQSSDMVLEVKIKTSDIDQVKLGQHTKIQLSAYNYKTTPLVNGEVVYLASDALTEPQNSAIMYYPAHVKVYPEDLKNLAHVNITPGMPAEAFVQLKSRTFVEYLFEPIIRAMRKTFREE